MSEVLPEETSLRFGRDDELFGTYHAAEGSTVVVFCAPFADEHKCAYRTFVETARALAAAGVPCLRFDYFGTGDSDGGFNEFLPSRAMDDVISAVAQAREMAGVSRIVLLGLRLGGTMALAAASRAGAESVILWQPVASGRAFFDLTIRQQMLRRQLIGKTEQAGTEFPVENRNARSQGGPTKGQRRSTSDENCRLILQTGGLLNGAGTDHSVSPGSIIDLDGFPLSSAAAEEIRGLDCVGAAAGYAGPVRLLQISHADAMSREYRPLAEALGDRLAFAAVKCEPFWNRIDLTDASPVIRQTLEWLADGDR